MPSRDHHLQETPSSCVAACVRMLQLAAGRAALPESEIREALGPPPVSLESARAFGRFEAKDIDDPRDVEWLLGVVRSRACAVTVCGGPAAAWAREAGPTTPHGALSSPPAGVDLLDWAHPRHVVLLIEASSTHVRYLDPYFGPRGQPVSRSLSEFIQRGWVGYALFLDD